MTTRHQRDPPHLLGRRRECETLDQLLTDARGGRSGVIVVRGEAGAGKSALLAYVASRVDRWHVATAAGVESEMELAYSGLHQLCVPMLDHLDRLPVPQRDALSTVFGLHGGAPPDRFLVGLATLTLLAEVAEAQPLVCIVDDAQWLDLASAQILGFVARRLLAEQIAIVCAARSGSGDSVLAELPALSLQGLADEDARALLFGNLRAPLDSAICDQIVAESHGNPLALLELPRTWDPAELAGGFGFPGGQPVAGKIEQSYAQRILELPADTRLFVLAAAAEPLGDPVLLLRAVDALGIDTTASHPAVDAGLFRIGARVEFSHPLVRSAAYRTASIDDRLRTHRALGEATDPDADPDRRAWHRANGTPAPSEQMAEELERSAGRAQARGGAAAAAAFLQRAVTFTDDPARRGERALAASQANLLAGAFDTALALLTTAEAGQLDGFQRARVDLVRAQVAFTSGFGSDAPPLLLTAAQALEPFELDLARETYLAAWGAAEMAGSVLGPGVLLDICRAVQALPAPTGDPRPLELLLEGLALLMTDGHAKAAPTLQRAANALTAISLDEVLRWGWMATFASTMVWDTETFQAISARHVQLVRDSGAVSQLPLHLWQLALLSMWTGDFAWAASLATESDSVAEATGRRIPPYTWLRLHALQGKEAEFFDVLTIATTNATSRRQGIVTSGHWGAAILFNGLGRYEEAATEAGAAVLDTVTRRPSMWALPELVEAAARCGDVERAHEAMAHLANTTQPCDTDFARGVEARCRALLAEGAAADELYRHAIDRLSRTRLRPDLARAHLLYGEWLRREGRRIDARLHLRTAHDLLSAMGMEAFAERARRELVGTGEKVRKHTDDARHQLTPQEEQIARLARDGMSNPAIGSQLFISARTVEWHLRKVFTKLDISSRNQLRSALPVDALARLASV